MFQSLSHSTFFQGVPAEELEQLFGRLSFSVKSYSKGQTIAQRDEEIKNFCFMLEGTVKGEMIDFNGKILKVEEIQALQRCGDC